MDRQTLSRRKEYTRNNRMTIGFDVFCAVRAEAKPQIVVKRK
jgi:hypothetical protein